MKTNLMTILKSTVLGGFILATTQVFTVCAQQPLSSSETAQIEKIVISTIEKHPEIIVKSLQQAMENEKKHQLELAKTAIKENQAALFNNPDIPAAGSPQGDVKIVTFFDYQCGFCKKSATELQALLKSDPNIRVIFRELPILGNTSTLLSKLALAANLQGKYVELHEAFMKNKGPLDEKKALKIAKDLGLDTNKLQKDMNSAEVQKIIDANFKLAETLNIDATPSFIVEETLIPGYISSDKFKKLIQDKRTSLQAKA